MFRRYFMSGFAVVVLAFFASARQPAARTDAGTGSGIKQGTQSPSSAQKNKKPSREPQPFGSNKPVYSHNAVCALALRSMHEKLDDARMGPLPTEGGAADSSTRTVEAMIALVPDPIHTHLALAFDRTVDTIQQALQDAPAEGKPHGWVYTSQWLPWDPMPYQAAEDPIDRTNVRTFDHGSECAPGILIFHNFQASPDSEPSRFLVVLLVGESPTAGINERQFQTALEVWHEIEGDFSAVGPEAPMLRVLGPTFSTSLFSLDRLLNENWCSTKKKPNCIETAQVISGSVSADPGSIARDFPDLKSAHFISLTESAIARRNMLLKYFWQSEHIPYNSVALLSEDQTQFGNFSGIGVITGPGEGPLIFHFPREISQLRNAYEQNSILSAPSSNQNQNVPNQALKLSLEDRHEQEDDVPSFSNQQDSISEESILSSITRTMASQRIRVVVISATDVLDEMFVARFLNRDLPNARIVLTEADQILLRRGDARYFRGMLTATTYPLIQDDTGWNARFLAGQPYNSLPDRIFPSTDSVGIYNAMRVLEPLATLSDDQADPACFGQSDCKSVDPKSPIFDYAYKPNQAPFAIQSIYHDDKSTYIKTTAPEMFSIYEMKDGKANYICYDLRNGTYILPKVIDSGYVELGNNRMEFTRDVRWLSGYENPFRGGNQPPLWLSAIGRSGFWPVALLDHLSPGASTTPQIFEGNSSDITSSKGEDTIPPEMFPPQSEQRLTAACIVLVGILFGIIFCAFASPIRRWPEYHFDLPKTVVGCSTPEFGTNSEKRAWIVFSIILCYSWIARLLILDLPWNEFRHDRNNWILLAAEVILFIFAIWVIRTALCKKQRPFWAGLLLFLNFVLQFAFYRALLPKDFAERIFYFYRSDHLLSGVSPVMPFICLFAAFICLFSRHVQALLVFSPSWRPRVPCYQGQGSVDDKSIENIFGACSSSWRLIHEILSPKSKKNRWGLQRLLYVIIILLAVAIYISARPGFETFETPAYSIALTLLSAFIGLFLLYEILWVAIIWGCLNRGLLIPLERNPLRVCFSRVAGFSWRRLWLSLDLSLISRYKPLSRAHESAEQLLQAHRCPGNVLGALTKVCKSFQEMYDATHEPNPKPSILFQRLSAYQTALKVCADLVITSILYKPSPARGPLATRYDVPAEMVNAALEQAASEDPFRASAEEFVGLIYIHAIQHVLIDIRSHIFAFVAGYLFLIVALNVYPVGPHHTIIVLLCVIFVVFVAVVLLVFTQMHRDSILSRTTNTESGKLGLDFYEKLIPVIGVPLIGLLASLFPEISSFLFSWLQPSLQAIK